MGAAGNQVRGKAACEMKHTLADSTRNIAMARLEVMPALGFTPLGRAGRRGVPIRPHQPRKVLLVCSTLDLREPLTANVTGSFPLSISALTAIVSRVLSVRASLFILSAFDSGVLRLHQFGASVGASVEPGKPVRVVSPVSATTIHIAT